MIINSSVKIPKNMKIKTAVKPPAPPHCWSSSRRTNDKSKPNWRATCFTPRPAWDFWWIFFFNYFCLKKHQWRAAEETKTLFMLFLQDFLFTSCDYKNKHQRRDYRWTLPTTSVIFLPYFRKCTIKTFILLFFYSLSFIDMMFKNTFQQEKPPVKI